MNDLLPMIQQHAADPTSSDTQRAASTWATSRHTAEVSQAPIQYTKEKENVPASSAASRFKNYFNRSLSPKNDNKTYVPPPPSPPQTVLEQKVVEEEDHLGGFFKDAKDVKTLLAEIAERQAALCKERQRCQLLIEAAEISAVRESMQDSIGEVVRLGGLAKGKLERMQKYNLDCLENGDEASADARARATLVAGLKTKFKQQIERFQELRLQWERENAENVKRDLFTVTGRQYCDEEVEHFIASGQQDVVFKQAILVGHDQVMATLTAVQSRNDEMKQLEANLLELYQTFADFAVLVHDHGQHLDNIEAWVEGTKANVRAGVEHLRVAKRDRRARAQRQAIQFVTGGAIAAAGAAATATGVGGVVGVPMMVAGGGMASASAL